MSREIKFRVWDKAYQVLVPWESCKDVLCFETLEDKNFHFMQSTGLKDKNGKEIYEGDVVKHGVYKGEVVFSGGEYMAGGSIGVQNGMIGFKYCEIIGNRYEHKHLLEEYGEQSESKN